LELCVLNQPSPKKIIGRERMWDNVVSVVAVVSVAHVVSVVAVVVAVATLVAFTLGCYLGHYM